MNEFGKMVRQFSFSKRLVQLQGKMGPFSLILWQLRRMHSGRNCGFSWNKAFSE